jgi:hypothetical protein
MCITVFVISLDQKISITPIIVLAVWRLQRTDRMILNWFVFSFYFILLLQFPLQKHTNSLFNVTDDARLCAAEYFARAS